LLLLLGGDLGIEYSKSLFYQNPNLEKVLNKKRVKLLPNEIEVPKKLIRKNGYIIDLVPILETQLTPIEYKYLKKSLYKYLSTNYWYRYNLVNEPLTLNIDIEQNNILNKKRVFGRKGKKYFFIYQKNKIYIHYKVVSNDGITIIKGYIPYRVIIKSHSKRNFDESLRLAKKSLYSRIGQLIANDLNKKYYYIKNYANVAIK